MNYYTKVILLLVAVLLMSLAMQAQSLSLQNPWDYSSQHQHGYKAKVAEFKKSKKKVYVANVADYASQSDYTEADVSGRLSFYIGVGPGAVQDSQNALLVSRRRQLTIGPSFVLGGMFKTNDAAYIYASGSYAQIYDHEFEKTSHVSYDIGAMYKPGFFGVGAGLKALTRPQFNQGNIGVNLKGMFTYPLTPKIEFISIAEYGSPIIERTTMSLHVGLKYTI